MDYEQLATTIRDAVRDLPKRYADNLSEIERLEKDMVGNVRKAKSGQLTRTYHCRVRRDLQDRINGV